MIKRASNLLIHLSQDEHW